MGLSMLTALELFTNPYDLEVTIAQQGGKYAFVIARGPGRERGKLMLSTSPVFASAEEAVSEVKQVLEIARQAIEKEFKNGRSFASAILNPKKKDLDPLRILSSSLIEQIGKKLLAENTVSTREMKPSSEERRR